MIASKDKGKVKSGKAKRTRQKTFYFFGNYFIKSVSNVIVRGKRG